MPGIDLTDFTQVDRKVFIKKEQPKSAPQPSVEPPVSTRANNQTMPIKPELIDGEMAEAQAREKRNVFKKHFFNINDFEGVPYNAADAEKKRKEQGIPEPDEMIAGAEHLD